MAYHYILTADSQAKSYKHCRTVSIFGLQLLYPRNSRVVRATEVLTEWLDATYSAFKVPIGIAIYQDYSTFGVLSCLDIIAGGY